MPTQYLTKEGTQLVIDDYNNKLSLKADKSELAAYATKADLDNINIPETDLTSYATKNYVTSAIAAIPPFDDSDLNSRITVLEGTAAGVYHWKGSKANLAALSEVQNPGIGDTYNLADTGMNVAWTGSEWDQFGSFIDLSEYVRTEDVKAMTLAEVNAILFGGKSAVVANVDSLNAVIASDQPKVEVTLNDDLGLTAPLVIPEGKELVLDLNGNDVANASGVALAVNGGKVTIKNGTVAATTLKRNAIEVSNGGTVIVADGATITSQKNQAINVSDGNVVVNGGEITGQESGIAVFGESEVIVNGGVITGIDNGAIMGNGSSGVGGADVTINGGKLVGHIQSPGYIALAIYWPNEGTLTLNNCEIESDGCGIVQRGGTVNIGSNVKITATGATGVLGAAGDSDVKVGPYAVVYDKRSKYPAVDTMELNIEDGAILTGTDGDIQIIVDDGDDPTQVQGITDERVKAQP